MKHFDDLTQIDCPYGMLDWDTQKRLRDSEGPYEMFGGDGVWSERRPVWAVNITYRLAPKPEPKPFVDPLVWRALAPEYRWIAMDDTGVIYAYTNIPQSNYSRVFWDANEHYTSLEHIAPGLLNFDGVAWDKSLVERPRGL